MITEEQNNVTTLNQDLTHPSNLFLLSTVLYILFGIGREHRIPLVKIRCMTDKRYKELKQLWIGQG